MEPRLRLAGLDLQAGDLAVALVSAAPLLRLDAALLFGASPLRPLAVAPLTLAALLVRLPARVVELTLGGVQVTLRPGLVGAGLRGLRAVLGRLVPLSGGLGEL